MSPVVDTAWFAWGVLPLLIFLARITDMSLDTMRIVMIGRGQRLTAALLGFFEVSIWLLVARQVIVHLPNPMCFVAYAAGFAAGNYVGMLIEERLASGAQIIRMVVARDTASIEAALRKRGFGYTRMSGQGAQGPVDILFAIVNRRQAREVVALVEGISPDVFYTIEDIRYVSEGIFPPSRSRGPFRLGTRK